MYKFINKLKKLTLGSMFLCFVVFLSACSDNTTTTTTPDNFSVSSTSNRNIVDAAADTLVLDTVKIMIKDIKLNVSNQFSDSTNFKTGPFVLYLALDSRVNVVSTALITNGTYEKIIFDFHKLEASETPPDPDFVDANGRYSTVVKGRFNGASFIFKSDISTHQKITFPVLISVGSAYTNVTISVSPLMWFLSAGIFLDPNLAANRTIIESNIRENINANIKAFRDNNKDGQPD